MQSNNLESPLEVLLLGFNKVASIDALSIFHLARLRVLHLQSNHLTALDGIENCSSLRELVLNKNRIRQLGHNPLLGLSNLHELHLQENGVRTLTHLNTLKSLQSLHLGYNRINDLAEISHLVGLRQLVNIAMNNNPVARKQLYRPTLLCHVENLRWIDGRETSLEERERALTILKGDPRSLSFSLVSCSF